MTQTAEFELPSLTTIEDSAPWRRVQDDTVVTRDSSGNARSCFRDNSWNIDAYGRNVRIRNLHFRGLHQPKSEPTVALMSQIQTKQIMYFLMHEVSDTMPAPTTLSQKLMCLRAFCRFASSRALSLYEALSNASVVIDYIGEMLPRKSQRLHAILVHLHMLGPARTGVEIPLGALHGPMMERFAERDEYRQHPVIPMRIYQHLLATCESHLHVIESALEELVEVVEAAYDSVQLPPSTPALHRLLELYDVECTVSGISRLMTEIGVFCQVVVIAFTGMRAAEAETLPYNCRKTVRVDGVDHFLIEGFTSKLVEGRLKRTSWVTSSLGVRAVAVAQTLFALAHRRFGSEGWEASTDGSHALVCRPGLCSRYDASRPPARTTTYFAALRERMFLPITEVDIIELKRIDPFRAWDEEPEFGLGAIWPFTRHQLRRSLALYAHGSGIVTLPSLKRQLQHLTREMAMYYARGSAFAQCFLKNDDTHFAHEWNDAAGLSEYLGYAAEVLFSDEKLFGGHAAWARSNAVLQSPVSVYSREQTVAAFEKGQMAYRETVLGGCTSTEPCKSSPLNWLHIECLEKDCGSLVVAPSKLERVIKAQRRLVDGLQQVANDSVEHRIESDVLNTLLAAQSKHLKGVEN